jgi:hypothetical protein
LGTAMEHPPIPTYNNKKSTNPKMSNQTESLLGEPQLYVAELHYNVNEDELKNFFKEVEPIRLEMVLTYVI